MSKKRKARGWDDGKTILGIPDADLGRRLFRLITGGHAGENNLLNVECSACACQVLEFAETPELESLGELLKRGPK